MKGFKAARGVAAAACVALGILFTASGALAASPIYLCINEKADGGVKSGGAEGKCPLPTEKVKYTKVALPREASQQQTLLSIMSHAKYVESGVGGKPTIQFSGVNVQIVNGEGKTRSLNGEGNLVIGYDEDKEGKHAQTGSHDLVLGEEQTFTSFAGIIAGSQNTISQEFASVLGGDQNIASGPNAEVVAGADNTASNLDATVSGGANNIASGGGASVTGGVQNTANNAYGSVTGGIGGTAGQQATVGGGNFNTASGLDSWLGGGAFNKAEGEASSVFGGKALTAKNQYEAIP